MEFEGTEMTMRILKDGNVLMEQPLSRFIIQEGNLAIGIKSKQMFDIPMTFMGVYDIEIILPGQVIMKKGIYNSYNYVVFSNTVKEEGGQERTYLDCSDNGLLFKVIG